MTDDIQKIFDEAKDSLLTHNERADMRNSMRAFMMEHPARAPLYLRILDTATATAAKLSMPESRALAPSILMLTLVVGAGTSYAAEGALPGDPLYAIKIHVNEQLQGRLATTQSEKAMWNTQLMTRRLEEAEQLAAEGRLTPGARASIQSQIAMSASDFNVHIAALENADNSAEAAQAQSSLEASLSGHAQVLSALADRKDAQNVVPLLASVMARREAAVTGRTSAEAAVSNSDDQTAKTAAITTKKEAGKAVEKVKESIAAAAQTDATSTIIAQMSVATAEQTIAAGEAKMEHGEYGAAFATFQSAARTADSARVHIDADVRLDIGEPAGTTTATLIDTTASTTAATTTPDGN